MYNERFHRRRSRFYTRQWGDDYDGCFKNKLLSGEVVYAKARSDNFIPWAYKNFKYIGKGVSPRFDDGPHHLWKSHNKGQLKGRALYSNYILNVLRRFWHWIREKTIWRSQTNS